MNAKEKRSLAEQCIPYAVKADFQTASRIRQQAYAQEPPGSIGLDWKDFAAVWNQDARFLDDMNQEDFSDLHNSPEFIASLRAALYVDMLFDFRDMWAETYLFPDGSEPICCPLLDEFFRKNDWPEENKLFIYSATQKANIAYAIYQSGPSSYGIRAPEMLQFFPKGQYNLGFAPHTPQRIIDARRKWLQTNLLHQKMLQAGIKGVPKTFAAFEKHFTANDAKYQDWYRQYQDITQ